jgi:ABC-type transport system substrate-binding protein
MLQAVRRSRSRRLCAALVSLAVLCALTLNSTTAFGSSPAVRRMARHGGTILATWQATLTTVDPAYTYSYVDWPQTHAIFSGLLGVDLQLHLFPDLAAAMPAVSNHGRTYTFRLRPGLVFSNGDPITAQDFVFSWERELAPKTASPDTYLWFALAGQAAYSAGKTKHISGLAAPNPTTLHITLTEPYPGFLNVLSIPTSYVVDPAVIHQFHAENKDFGVHAVGSGPFILQDWVAGQKMDLVRNPHYRDPQLPQADAVHIDLGVDPSVALLRIEKGQADLMGDAIPSAQFASVITDPKLAPLVQHRTDVGVYMIAMNVKVKPFDNLKVRQAVAYAINKLHAVRFINGRGTAATRIIPPSMPGFGTVQPELYPYNPARARQLLAAAGYPNGFSTTMGVPDSVFETRMAEAAINDLAQVGIKITFKKVVTEGSAVATMPMQAYHWLLDYPDPADFIDGFTSCASAVPGGSNVGFYCNSTLDDMANAARGMAFGPARVAAYQKIDSIFTADASSVPVFNDVFYEIHSARLRNFQISLSWYPFDLSQPWPAG